MDFPRLLTRVAKMTRSKIYWSKWDLDQVMTPAMVAEFNAWKTHYGIVGALRPVDLLRLHARGNHEAEIKSLFRTHEQMPLFGAFYTRLEGRKNRGLARSQNTPSAGRGTTRS